MNNKIPPLMWVLVLTSVFLAAVGAYLKYSMLKPLELYQDESIIAVPFMLLSDETAQYMLMNVSEEEPEMPEATQHYEILDPVTATEYTQPPEEIPEITEPEPVVIDESWFDDALFIGDSRTQGMQNFGSLGEAHYFCDVGLSVYSAQTKRCYIPGHGRLNLPKLLSKQTYGKIYISLGINEIMGVREKFLESYQELINLIRETQPDAIIILQGVMTVDRKKAASKDCFSLESIYGLNEDIEALAVGENIYYIDVNEWIADEEGYLPDGWSQDGTHPYAAGYAEWSQWIIEKTGTLGIT